MESINVKVLDQRIDMSSEDPDNGTNVNDTCPDDTSWIVDGKTVDDKCDDSMDIQPSSRIQKSHHVDNIIGQLDHGVTTRKEPVDYKRMVGLIGESCFISKEEPKNDDEALKDKHWISGIQDELL
ncbi:hypothetical protein LIER_22400 [Lithospermum erythrorhizon]|uniref:Mitochondrial protein n=1 Tax=Lithospermum erythrorhizon TaxID=34254 RepID=A0AAV3QTY9_LITER